MGKTTVNKVEDSKTQVGNDWRAKMLEKEKKKRMTFKERKEWEEIDGLIADTEEKIEKVTAEIAQTGSDFTKALELTKQERGLNELLEHLIERWSYLAELAENE